MRGKVSEGKREKQRTLTKEKVKWEVQRGERRGNGLRICKGKGVREGRWRRTNKEQLKVRSKSEREARGKVGQADETDKGRGNNGRTERGERGEQTKMRGKRVREEMTGKRQIIEK